MKIEKTSTGLIIHDPTDELKHKILRYFSLSDPEREFFIYSGNDRSKRPLFGKEHDVVYITSGMLKVKDEKLQSMLRHYNVIPIPTPQSIDLEMTRSPRSQIQEDCISEMIKKSNDSRKLTIQLAGGTGKLEPYSTLIPTPTPQGFTRMGDLKVGDYVFDRTGKPTKILEIFEQGVTDIYKVTFKDGRSVLCGKEHLWTVKTHKNGIWKTVETKDMMKDYKTLSSHKKSKGLIEWDYKYYIPSCKPVQYPHQDVPIDPWVLGCFIGNGCCTLPQLSISCRSDEIPIRIAEMYDFELCYPKHNRMYTFKKDGHYVKTKDFFKSIPSIIGKYSHEKFIPNEYMYNDIQTRIKIVQGLMDVNGSINPNGGRFLTQYTSPSKRLLKQIQRLIYSFGYSASIVIDKHGWKYKNGFCGKLILHVPHTFKKCLFTVKRKFDIAQHANESPNNDFYPKMMITDIRKIGKDNARCILVDNDEIE